MTDAIKQSLRDKPAVRWTALILVAATMFFAYMFVDVLSPLKTQLEQQVNWSSTVFGSYGSSEFFINVFFGFLILAGIILDRMGVRFTAILSGSLMLLGALIKVYALSEVFNGGGFGYDMLNSFSMGFPPSAKLACVGFAIFGCGCEMAGVTVSCYREVVPSRRSLTAHVRLMASNNPTICRSCNSRPRQGVRAVRWRHRRG